MTHDDLFYDKYKANMAMDRSKLEQKFKEHAPPRSLDTKRPRDEELHTRTFQSMDARPQGNPNSRRSDNLELNIVRKPDRSGGPL